MNSKRTAFTLIEILVAVTIFSIILSIVAYYFRFSVNAVKFVKTPYLEELILWSKIRDSFNSLFFYVSQNDTVADVDGRFKYFFIGSNKEVIFVTAKPILHKEESLYSVDLKFTNGSLVLKEYPVYDKDMDYKLPFISVKTDYKTVVENLEKFNVSYYVDGTWKDSISYKIPFLVKISLKTDKGRDLTFIFKPKSNFYVNEDIAKYNFSSM